MTTPEPPDQDTARHRQVTRSEQGPARPGSRRGLYIVGGVVVVAVVALVAVLLSRPSSNDAGGPTVAPEPAGPTTSTSTPSAGSETSAATLLGWDEPNRVDEFDGPRPAGWNIYQGEGHDGNGTRTAAALHVDNGILTIKGDADGNTGGLAMVPGQMYGRWEGRLKMPASDPSYHALMLLWPDKEDWPQGGEVDFVEATDGDRQSVNSFLHYGRNNNQTQNTIAIDATQWHNWAVEWTPDHVIGYVDGHEWYRIEEKDHLPPRPMHLCIQLDWFPEDGNGGKVQPSEMQVDWIKQYTVKG